MITVIPRNLPLVGVAPPSGSVSLPVPVIYVEPGRGGAIGPVGPSAYDVAVTNGFIGTQAEWLLSLHASGAMVTQATPASTWTLANPLSRICGVAVFVGSEEVIADVTVTPTWVTVVFSSPQSGSVVLS